MSSEIIHGSTPACLHPLSPAFHPHAWPPLNRVNFLLVTCFLLFCQPKIRKPSIRVRHARVFGQLASVCPVTGLSLHLISSLNQISFEAPRDFSATTRCCSSAPHVCQNKADPCRIVAASSAAARCKIGKLKLANHSIVSSTDVTVMSLPTLYTRCQFCKEQC